MPQITANFTTEEFTRSRTAIRSGIDNTVPEKDMANLKQLANSLEDIRSLVGAPLVISSGYRSPELNRAIGGSTSSAHSYGLAADIHTPAMSCKDLAQLIVNSKIPFDQVIYEIDWVHFGLSRGKNRYEVLTAIFIPGKRTRYTYGIK